MLARALRSFQDDRPGMAVDASPAMGFLRGMSLQSPAWLPTRVAVQPDKAYVLLQDVARNDLRDPFLQQTVMRSSGPEEVLEIARDEAAAGAGVPAGIIFHVGRCGSTLVSQTLKQIDGLNVYAEPLAINELLVPASTWSRAESIVLLRRVAQLFARHAAGPYVWKLTSWNALFASLFAEAFPNTPWVFCVRDPVEVGVSVLRDAPAWFAAADPRALTIARLYGATAGDKPEARFLKLFAALCGAVADIGPNRGQLVDYIDLPNAIWNGVAPHCGFEPTDAERERMSDLAKTYAKAPLGQSRPFYSDAAAKRGEATTELRAGAEIAADALTHLRGVMLR